MERKLVAIFSTDVKGYSRLMGEDEVATIRTLTAYRTLMATLIQQHRGRVVDSPGDNLLAEFPSVVQAVECAVAIQRELKVRNAALPLHRGGGVTVWHLALHPSAPARVVPAEKAPTVAVPEVPSIVVLPFIFALQDALVHKIVTTLKL
jgi:hypothetical protein